MLSIHPARPTRRRAADIARARGGYYQLCFGPVTAWPTMRRPLYSTDRRPAPVREAEDDPRRTRVPDPAGPGERRDRTRLDQRPGDQPLSAQRAGAGDDRAAAAGLLPQGRGGLAGGDGLP